MNLTPIVDCKINYESFDACKGSLGNIASRIPVSSMISLLLPEQSTVDEIQDIVNQSEAFLVDEFHIADIFHKSFLDSFISTGRFDCFPTTRLDEDFKIEKNVLRITMLKSSTHEHSIDELVKFKTKDDDEFTRFKIFLADLTTADLSKLRNDLTSLIPSTSVNFTYVNDSISAESIAKYFQDLGRKTKKLETIVKINPEINLSFPQVDDEDLTTLYDISEYFGMIILGLDNEETPTNSISIGNGFSMHIKGLLSPMTSLEIVKILQSTLNENEDIPWLGISFSGIDQKSKFLILKKTGKIHFL